MNIYIYVTKQKIKMHIHYKSRCDIVYLLYIILMIQAEEERIKLNVHCM